MSFRFRRTITVFPGVRLNFSKSGISFSIGRRGASISAGTRGAHLNLGIPGSGLSYRTRLDISAASNLRAFAEPERVTHSAARTHEQLLRDLLVDRERGAIVWSDRALWLAEPAPADDEDDDAFEQHARRISAGRFARRMVEGDRAAWSEVLREELLNEELPFDFGFDWGVESSPERVHIALRLPPIEVVELTRLPIMKLRELHEDVCCALLLRVAYEIFRVIPDADDLYLLGYMPSIDPSTGKPARNIFLRLATDRESFDQLVLDRVDPSSAYELLGGVSKRHRGELQPTGMEPIAEV